MERALGLADGLRREALRAVLLVRPLRPIYASFERRVAAAALLAVATSALAALFFPLLSLWLGAALFGVPHLVSGLRHTVARRGLTPVAALASAGAAALGLALVLGAPGWLHAYPVLFAIAVGAEVLSARARPGPTALALLATLVALRLCLRFPGSSMVALTHLHAASSVAYFAVCARRRGVAVAPMLLGAMAVVLLGASGALDALLPEAPWSPGSATTSLLREARGTALAGASAVALRRALFLYAFGQALHYAVWLRLMPEVDRPTPMPKPWRAAWALLRRDFGRWAWPALGLGLVAAPLLLAGGAWAREVYFGLAYFHVGLEAAALARLALASGRAGARALTGG